MVFYNSYNFNKDKEKGQSSVHVHTISCTLNTAQYFRIKYILD
jgi:hypothetical protein